MDTLIFVVFYIFVSAGPIYLVFQLIRLWRAVVNGEEGVTRRLVILTAYVIWLVVIMIASSMHVLGGPRYSPENPTEKLVWILMVYILLAGWLAGVRNDDSINVFSRRTDSKGQTIKMNRKGEIITISEFAIMALQAFKICLWTGVFTMHFYLIPYSAVSFSVAFQQFLEKVEGESVMSSMLGALLSFVGILGINMVVPVFFRLSDDFEQYTRPEEG